MRIHPVFHVLLLEPVAVDPLPAQKKIPPPPPPIEVDGELEFYVEEILDSRRIGKSSQLQYLVKWAGDSQPTWEPFEHVKDLEALDKFFVRFPKKPRPTARRNSQ